LIFSLVDDFYSTMNYNFQTIIYKIKQQMNGIDIFNKNH